MHFSRHLLAAAVAGALSATSALADSPLDDIFSAALNTNQTVTIPADAAPAPAPAATVATNTSSIVDNASVDGQAPARRSQFFPRGMDIRALADYNAVPGPSDAAITAINYLTYTVFRGNETVSWPDFTTQCAAFCDRTSKCVSWNLYQEYNNQLLDHVFSEHSNVKCALFGDVATADEMTNKGGQYFAGYDKPNYITQSTVFTKTSLPVPQTPSGYDLVPIDPNAAIEGSDYMGYVALTSYSPQLCATECQKRAPGPDGKQCSFFNIFRTSVNGTPRSYTCSLYTGSHSTSTNVGQWQGANHITIGESRAYVVHTDSSAQGGTINLASATPLGVRP
ncbi:unnamed protein product [Jaminaea pallidilutea]